MIGEETKHVTAFRQQHLKPNEKIVATIDGWIGEMMGKGDKTQHNGAFILTDGRAVFYRRGIFGEVFETMPLTKITSVETKSLLGYRVLNLHTSHDELKFKSFSTKELFDQVYAELESLRHKPEGASAPVVDPLEQLRKLGELRDAGVITDVEFNEKKTVILSRL